MLLTGENSCPLPVPFPPRHHKSCQSAWCWEPLSADKCLCVDKMTLFLFCMLVGMVEKIYVYLKMYSKLPSVSAETKWSSQMDCRGFSNGWVNWWTNEGKPPDLCMTFYFRLSEGPMTPAVFSETQSGPKCPGVLMQSGWTPLSVFIQLGIMEGRESLLEFLGSWVCLITVGFEKR